MKALAWATRLTGSPNFFALSGRFHDLKTCAQHLAGAEIMVESARTYLPAAGRDWLLPFYDPIVKLIGGEAVRGALLDQADLRPGQRVLEIGCGTGSLTAAIKSLHPDVEVVGLDP